MSVNNRVGHVTSDGVFMFLDEMTDWHLAALINHSTLRERGLASWQLAEVAAMRTKIRDARTILENRRLTRTVQNLQTMRVPRSDAINRTRLDLHDQHLSALERRVAALERTVDRFRSSR